MFVYTSEFMSCFKKHFYSLGIYVPLVNWFERNKRPFLLIHGAVFLLGFGCVVAVENHLINTPHSLYKALAAFYFPQIAIAILGFIDHEFIGWRRRVVIKAMRSISDQLNTFGSTRFKEYDQHTGCSMIYEKTLPAKRRERKAHFIRNKYWIWWLVLIGAYSVACYEGVWQVRCIAYSFALIFLVCFENNFQKYYSSPRK